MKYEIIIENSLKSTDLKRVRIKVDPSLVSQASDLSQCHGYEGYILAETGDVPKVLVMSPDGVSSVMDIPAQYLQLLLNDEESEALRAFKDYICQTCEMDPESPEAELLTNTQSIEEVEALLKQVGLTDDELKALYRNFIINDSIPVNEGAFTELLKKAGKATLKTVTSPAAWAKGAGSVISGLGGGVLAKPFTAAGNAMEKGYQAYGKEKINFIEKEFDRLQINNKDFIKWLINPTTAGLKPSLKFNVAAKRELLSFINNSKYDYSVNDILNVVERQKLNVSDFVKSANDYLKAVKQNIAANSSTT